MEKVPKARDHKSASPGGGFGMYTFAHMKTRPVTVVVNDKMQKNYKYILTEPEGKNFDPRFRPQLTPKEMLKLGVFGGKYMTDGAGEFPKDWFTKAKLSPNKHDPKLNFFGVKASQPLSV